MVLTLPSDRGVWLIAWAQITCQNSSFPLNHCIWYSSATATHSDLYFLQSSALLPHNSALCLGMLCTALCGCDLSEAGLRHGKQCWLYWSWGGRKMFKLGAEERNSNIKAPGFAMRNTSLVNNSPVSPPVPFGWCCPHCCQPVSWQGSEGAVLQRAPCGTEKGNTSLNVFNIKC